MNKRPSDFKENVIGKIKKKKIKKEIELTLDEEV